MMAKPSRAGEESKLAQPVKSRGKAPARTDEQLAETTSAQAMQVLASDAAQTWKDDAPRVGKRLLDVKGD